MRRTRTGIIINDLANILEQTQEASPHLEKAQHPQFVTDFLSKLFSIIADKVNVCLADIFAGTGHPFVVLRNAVQIDITFQVHIDGLPSGIKWEPECCLHRNEPVY